MYSIRMSSHSSRKKLDPAVMGQSALFKEVMDERDEVLRHKWLESEKAGHDIGLQAAWRDWQLKHRSAWLATKRASTNRKRSAS